MEDPNHYRIMVPNDIQLQRHLSRAYHDSPIGRHRGREATYEALTHDFYWPNVAKHVRNWMRRCPSCIKLKSTDPKQRLMQIRIFDGPIDTLVIPSHYPIFARAVSAGNTLRHLGLNWVSPLEASSCTPKRLSSFGKPTHLLWWRLSKPPY